MRRVQWILILMVLSSTTLFAQLFTAIPSNVPQLSKSSVAWGDFDNDGDLDLVLLGEQSTGIPLTKIFRNNDGDFEDINASLEGLANGSVEWGDYDEDGDHDLLITGMDDQMASATLIYRNDTGIFVNSGILLPGIISGDADWGDYDNDGDLDILMAGAHEGLQFLSAIMRNDGDGLFTDLQESLSVVQSASVAWVDYNNDGKLDVMIGGDSGGGMITRLYKQENGSFTEVNPEGFMGLSFGDIKWGDLDNDGDMDAVVTGSDNYLDGKIMLYENKGNDEFTQHYSFNNNITSSSIDFGDFNNDGWLDVILMGKIVGCGGLAVTMLFRNETFLNFFEESSLLPGYRDGDVKWSDFNNDGFIDLVFSGMDGFGVPKTHIYTNNGGSGGFTTNTPPEMPQDLLAITEGTMVKLNWNQVIDSQTPSAGMSYNLYIGTTPGIPDIVSPGANPASGIRYLASLGNASQDTSWTIKDLEDGQYYWSVQAIDNGFMGSSFSPEQSFTINAVGIGEKAKREEIAIYPNPVKDQLTIRTGYTGKFESFIQIYSQSGQLILSKSFTGGQISIDAEGFPPGIFIIMLKEGTEIRSAKFIKE